MLDPKKLRTDFQEIAVLLHKRGFELDVAKYQNLEDTRKASQIKIEELQAKSKKLSREISLYKDKQHEASDLFDEAKTIKAQIDEVKGAYDSTQEDMRDFCLNLPNLPSDTTPIGKNADDNVVVRQWGDKPQFSFKAQDHADIGSALGLLDDEAAGKLSGARFTVFYDEFAELQRALTRWMLDMHTGKHGYREAYVPYLVTSETLIGTGQLPKFSDELFHIQDRNLHLIPTAEVALTNLYRDQIVLEDDLPIRLVAHTPCFRSEAGSYGKDTRGIMRQHQFEKVELVQIVCAEESFNALEEITAHAEAILQGLKLPYQVVALCSGDLGFASSKTYDLELWVPSQEKYMEVSSCSNMTDFQARRMKGRVRRKDKNIELLHTLNGSGLAVGRTLIGVLENYQQEDGSVCIPEVLVPYMNGKTRISKA